MQLTSKRLAILLLAVLPCSLSTAARAENLSREQLETRLAAVNSEIAQLQEQLSAARQRFNDEQGQLRSIDLEIQAAALELREMQEAIVEHQDQLNGLRQERSAFLDTLAERQDQLALQIVAAYRLGRASRLRLLLNQDDPGRLGRTMAYYDYFSRAYASQIRELRDALDRLERMQAEIDQALSGLRQAEELARNTLQEMQRKRSERQALLATLARGMEDDEVRLQELSRDRADLETLLERLSKALADIPSDLGQYQHPRKLRGNLPMPLKGRVLHAFGQSRIGGMHWQGWLIEAESGAEVRAIAYGRVVYADWLRGYGLLMVIDHGEGFMSLYGNNESLLFEPGDWVQPGTSIGTVGSDPGSGQGLYFELRADGEAIDPAVWVKRG
jgi:septal ring factor EnvC (AmiA/AmiB activator)